MKGRGEIIAILCMSVFLICILYAMTYGGIVKAEELEKQPEKVGEKTEVDIEEELRWAEEVKKILKDIGGGDFVMNWRINRKKHSIRQMKRRYKVQVYMQRKGQEKLFIQRRSKGESVRSM